MARAVRGRPFERLDEALLQGFVFAVVKDVLLLGVLGGAGLFLQPILAAVDAALILAGLFLLRPFAAPAVLRLEIGWSPLGLLLLVAWAAPLLLQLASPVVPFLDVLPNHVAPAEHLRTFGTLSHLTDTQSPIYGPSRIFLGYTALLGSITHDQRAAGRPGGGRLHPPLHGPRRRRDVASRDGRRRSRDRAVGPPGLRDDDLGRAARGRPGDGHRPAAGGLGPRRHRRRASGARSGAERGRTRQRRRRVRQRATRRRALERRGCRRASSSGWAWAPRSSCTRSSASSPP